MAGGGLLDVSGHESRQAGAGRAVRVNVEPQLRGPPGARGPDPPGVAGRGRRQRHRRPPRGTDRPGGPVMDAVRTLSGRAVPLGRADVDTDQIIPAEWLKRVERTGFGPGLFSTWREKERDFVLNRAEHAGASIL